MPPSPLNPATIRHRRPSPSVSVVIPVRDPGGLPLMLRGLPPVDEVIVVCEGPTTETAAVVRSARPDARVLRPGRPGAGNALATGLAASSCDVVVTLNGDGSTDPGEIPRYVDALTGGADVVLGSRYREGGRDLTGGRFRRWANLLLIWIVNTVFGTDRTDPGFGYTAFWRDALERLDLPDPSPRAGAARTDGPELFPLLTLRPAVLGLRVAEVGSVAYPRMSRPARADRPTLTHWLRVMAGELRGRRGRHSDARADGDPSTRPSSGPSTRPSSQPSSRLSAQLSAQPDGPAARAGSTRPDGSAARTGFGPRWGLGARLAAADAHGETTQDQASTRPGRPASDRRSKGEPLWGPPSRRLAPARDLWQAGENPISHTSPRSIANLTPHAWRSGYPGRVGARAIDLPDPAAGPGSAGTSGPGKADTSDSATADASGLGGTDPSSPGDTSASGLGGTDASGGTGVSGPGGAGTSGIGGAGTSGIGGAGTSGIGGAGTSGIGGAGTSGIGGAGTSGIGGGGIPGIGSFPLGRGGGGDSKPRSGEDGRPDWADSRGIPPQPSGRREVGTKRRRIEGFRQRPDLRVINGEGNGTGRTRSGRLRPVPRENLGN